MALSYRVPLELSIQPKEYFLDNAAFLDHLAPLPSSHAALGFLRSPSPFKPNPSSKTDEKSTTYRSDIPDLVGMMALPHALEDDFVLYPSHESDSRCMSDFSDDFVEEARVLINQLADAPIDISVHDSPSRTATPSRDAQQFDSTLDSPLGLSDLHFDFSPLDEYLISPLFTTIRGNTEELSDLSELATTPDLSHSSLEMDLFAPSPTPASPEETIVEEAIEQEEEEVKQEQVEEEEVKEVRTTRSTRRKPQTFVLELGARSVESGKRLFNGTRSTAFDIVPLDAPIQKRKFVTPSRTSRKRLPKAIERILPPSKRQRLKSVKLEEDDGEYQAENAGELPQEIEDIVERKRKENTLAARVSRQRKKQNLDALVAENSSFKKDNADLIKENEKLSRENEKLRRQLGSA